MKKILLCVMFSLGVSLISADAWATQWVMNASYCNVTAGNPTSYYYAYNTSGWLTNNNASVDLGIQCPVFLNQFNANIQNNVAIAFRNNDSVARTASCYWSKLNVDDLVISSYYGQVSLAPGGGVGNVIYNTPFTGSQPYTKTTIQCNLPPKVSVTHYNYDTN